MEITILAFGAILATFANDTAVEHFVEIVKYLFSACDIGTLSAHARRRSEQDAGYLRGDHKT